MNLEEFPCTAARMPDAADPVADVARPYERPSFLLRRTHQLLASIFESDCADLGLTPAQYARADGAARRPHAQPVFGGSCHGTGQRHSLHVQRCSRRPANAAY